MRFKVSGYDKDTGLPIELTLDAVDVSSAAMLAGQKGIQAPHVHQIDASVPPLMQHYATHATVNTTPVTQDDPPLTPKPKARVWLGVLFFITFLLAPWLPSLTLLIGLSLATAIILYLRVPRLEQRLGRFFRVSSDHPNWRIVRLTMFGIASLIIIMTSIGGFLQEHATAELIAKNAADAAARKKAESDANLQVTSRIEKAKNALIIGNLDKANADAKLAAATVAPKAPDSTGPTPSDSKTTDIILKNGNVLKDATIASHTPATVIVISADGIQTFSWAVMPDELQKKYNYRPEGAKNYIEQSKADEQKQADEAAKAAEQQKVQEAARQAAIKAAMPRATEVFTMAEEYVKATLKAPSTASFGGIFNDYQNPDSNVIIQSDGTYVVRIWVDAQNSFGAKLRSHFVLKLKYLGGDDLSDNSWQLLDIQSDS